MMGISDLEDKVVELRDKLEELELGVQIQCYSALLTYTNALIDAIHASDSTEQILNDPKVKETNEIFLSKATKVAKNKLLRLKYKEANRNYNNNL